MNTLQRALSARTLALGVGLTVVLTLAPARVAAVDRVTNQVNLDDGTCVQNLQIGSDKKASRVSMPSFILWGDGGLSSYRIFIDGTVIGTFASDGFANVCIYTTKALAEGAHVMTGNELAPHSTYTITPLAFTVDTIPPSVPSRPLLSAYSDSGIVGDGITKYRGVNFSGTSDPGLPMQVNNGPSGLAGASADATGHWSATTTQLADGTYAISAIGMDRAGNKSAASAPYALTIDTTAPAAPPAPTLDPGSDTSPLGDGATTIANPTVVGTGAAGMWKVTVFVDGVQAGVATPDGAGAWRLTLPALIIGPHAITAGLTDRADNAGPRSSPLQIGIGSGGIAPIAPIAPLVPPTATVGALAYWQTSTSVHLTWGASPGSAVVTSYDVEYRRARWNGGFGARAVAITGTAATSATFAGAAPGATYCYSVRAHDAAGSVSAWTAETCTVVPLDDPSLVKSGTWTSGTGSSFYQSTYRRTNTAGARLTRTGVVARRIAIVATTCPTCGKVRVYWGSTLLKTVSLYSATTVNRRILPIYTFSSARTGTLSIRDYGTSRKVVIDGVALGGN